MQVINIYKAAGILIKDKKLLVEKSVGKEFFIAPGGSIEVDETPKQSLVRELQEEFQVETKIEDFEEFGTFTAEAAGQTGKIVQMNVFIVKNWVGEPTPDHEVEQILWTDSNIPPDIKVGSIFEHEVIPRLKTANLIS
ncbi:MAG: NUDIX hydrolase [candidate division WWE3 bacterium GW2011_GWC1_41_7]|uniref:8-oxo-dGTP diphosphatase n=3 Tax=Katanobacteria TaxID=422282 RepID=A0A0G0ZI46_UNCKA|nr:MAG: NUDIX hydrolase [candidate division WWE3 bacterium GW2011_GWB1_41_6]KKS19990.1 MAG: NUDIX hydrolase [candidate division WWE3 bacterium GW2011_GWC1_41_7]KKS21706.1 MAG: NUDIX hydrolase [candidate division WWE3 bacterium GW2011_GWA1_41_8]